MSEKQAVRLENVTKKFGDFTAVNNISLEINTGEIFVVIGPNGAGKTTMVNMICGMFPQDSGQVTTLGLNPTQDERKLRDILGVQFQEAKLPGLMTAKEALQLYSSFYESPRGWQALANEWGLSNKLDTKFEKLSGGQKQRLFICLALLNNPQLVVLDELTTGLDPNARRQSWELVKQIREGGTTVLLVTHFMEEAEVLADRVAVISGGELLALGTPEELTSSHDDKRVVTFTANGFHPQSLSGFGQVSVSGDQVTVEGGKFLMAEVAGALRDAGIDPPNLSTKHTSLDDLFVSLTGDTNMEEA